MFYTVIIDPDGDEEVEDYKTEEEATSRVQELFEHGIYAVLGWTD